jgi:hypothetical protein
MKSERERLQRKLYSAGLYAYMRPYADTNGKVPPPTHEAVNAYYDYLRKIGVKSMAAKYGYTPSVADNVALPIIECELQRLRLEKNRYAN